MAYTTIDNPELYFQTKLYTGNASTQSITLDGSENMQPDWVWIKNRTEDYEHTIFDSVRGVQKFIRSSTTGAEATNSNSLTAFGTDGFSIGTESAVNDNSDSFVSWNWLAGGSAPAITYTVKVVSDSGNKYRFDDFGTSAVTLDLQEGGTYTFDQSDSSNSGHPLRFYTASDKSGGEYTTGVTTSGTAGSSGAKTVITVAASAPTLYYQCSNHAGMGGQANTNSTFGSSNFGGSIQANVSANTTALFSIVSYTGTGANATVGHGLGVAPKLLILKSRTRSDGEWAVGSDMLGWTKFLFLNQNASEQTFNLYQNTAPTSSVFYLSGDGGVNKSGGSMIGYAFAEKKGYTKFGSYTGNGGTSNFVYTGFKPAWLLAKKSSGTGDWFLIDNKRSTINPTNHQLEANSNAVEDASGRFDFLSNGFNCVSSSTGSNGSGTTYIYLAFAESPFVNSNGVPTNAR